jgi:hypothetical protein
MASSGRDKPFGVASAWMTSEGAIGHSDTATDGM